MGRKPTEVKNPYLQKSSGKRKGVHRKASNATNNKYLKALYYTILVLVLITFTIALPRLRELIHGRDYKHYYRYNVKVPANYHTFGIDVSAWQGTINWQEVAKADDEGAKITFAYIKATEGTDFIDKFYKLNIKKAMATGLVAGAYHYFKPGADAEKQALFFLKVTDKTPMAMPLAIDVEETGGLTAEALQTAVRTMADILEVHTGKKPVIYSGLHFYKNYLMPGLQEYPLWIAHYYKPDKDINQLGGWQIWQCTDKALVPGVRRPVDFNVISGNLSEVAR